ncbi:hypothetical protein [Rhizobium jaguaris]|uniref:CpXC domain-containing protein n=1 Tax=Rhizobium jaguaris TaxID=1312183 RepID=A0A387FNW8_9HYPH|nr:hypothetical protein [Rhizobium jaguaris]AYG61140.1 hypothetical protein CCGE525_21735 [Rhizobium jaguaris]
MQESIHRPATVSFVCPVCKGGNVWDVTVAPYKLTVDDPRQAIGISETDAPCPDCRGTIYTIVVENHGGVVKTFIRDNPNIKVRLESYEITRYEDFLHNYYPTDPLTTFDNAKLELAALIMRVPESVRDSVTFSRMAFLQWMGMMEALTLPR